MSDGPGWRVRLARYLYGRRGTLAIGIFIIASALLSAGRYPDSILSGLVNLFMVLLGSFLVADAVIRREDQ